MFYLLVCLVPCYPVCHLLPFVHRGFPSAPPVAPPPQIPLVGFPSVPPVPPPFPNPLGTTTHGGFPALSAQLCLILGMNRSAASRTPRYHLPACTYSSRQSVMFCCSLLPIRYEPLPLPPPLVPVPTGTMVQIDSTDEDEDGGLLSPEEESTVWSLRSDEDDPKWLKVRGQGE